MRHHALQLVPHFAHRFHRGFDGVAIMLGVLVGAAAALMSQGPFELVRVCLQLVGELRKPVEQKVFSDVQQALMPLIPALGTDDYQGTVDRAYEAIDPKPY